MMKWSCGAKVTEPMPLATGFTRQTSNQSIRRKNRFFDLPIPSSPYSSCPNSLPRDYTEVCHCPPKNDPSVPYIFHESVDLASKRRNR